MADANSITFWSEVAARYSGDGRVLFELYNEPHDVAWSVWKSGGAAGGFQVAGMQQLYDAVRGAGADNLVVMGGLSWAYDLSGVPDNRVSGYNILYATHPYNNSPASKPAGFDAAWGFLTKTDPVIVTEFGDGGDCGSGSDAIRAGHHRLRLRRDHLRRPAQRELDRLGVVPGWLQFPGAHQRLDRNAHAPRRVVQSALAGYGQPAPGGKRDAGSLPDAGSASVDGGALATAERRAPTAASRAPTVAAPATPAPAARPTRP